MKNYEPNVPKAKLSSRLLVKVLLACSLWSTSFTARAQADSTQIDSLTLKIGQMIMIGLGEFNQPTANDPIFKAARAGTVGGVVVYEKNVDPKAPYKSLKGINNRLQDNAMIPLFISIDEEGGLVNRLKPKYGFPATKKASELGLANNLDSTAYYAGLTSQLLDSLGINLNYAPDIDVNVNAENPVIGKLGRSFGSDPYAVARHAQAVVEAHRKDSVGTVIKHFPGHGSSSTDTHKDITDVSGSWVFYELLPFKALIDSGKVDAIMTAHIINARLDTARLPATLSKSVITGMLRDFMGYKGVVISDDMQMHAISKHYGLENAIELSINAGVDIIMFANNVPQTQRRTIDEIQTIIRGKVTSGAISEARIDEAYQRIMALKRKLGIIETAPTETLKKEGTQD